MTEKRFTECDDGTYCLVDNGKGLEYDEVISLLNALHEENKQLKQTYTQLKHRNSLLYDVYIDARCDRDIYRQDVVSLEKENEQLREALKNSYINEICENCKYGHYWISETFGYGLEGDFECTKKHFGNDHWKCCELTECDDFELDLKGDDVE